MIRTAKTLWGSLLAVPIVCAAANPANAEALHFHNECNGPVVVQAVSVFRGVLRRDRPYLLRPGDATPAITLPGDKVITIYDGKAPNRVLFQSALPAGQVDVRFSILPNPPAPRVRLQVRPPGP